MFAAMATTATLAPSSVGALSQAQPRRELYQGEDRDLMTTGVVVFEECVGLALDDCEAIIQTKVDENPNTFPGITSLDSFIRNVRTDNQENYYMVGMRTNIAETHVIGVLKDGMIFYPWEWCHTADECYSIGPWDCDVGTPLTVEECCNMVTATVTHADMNGNYLECFVDPPVGSASNPTDKSRVCIHVDENNIVMTPPRNEQVTSRFGGVVTLHGVIVVVGVDNFFGRVDLVDYIVE